MYLFSTLQDEVKRRATMNEGGTEFNVAIKNIINSSLFRISREAPFRVMRRRAQIRTNAKYSTGSGSGNFTSGSTYVSVTNATWITNNIKIDRRIKLSGDSEYHRIKAIHGETGLSIGMDYTGSATTTTGTYSILGQEEYNLPIQAGHRMFMWHEEYGYPLKMSYLPDNEFYDASLHNTTESVPVAYRMWGEDMVIDQLLEPSTISISSSDTNDTSIEIMVYGMVEGYPDYETITTNSTDGTTASAGSKSFQSIERVVKTASTAGRITATGNSGNTTVAVMPVGDTTAGIIYRKMQLWPLPSTQFDIQVQYYKDPYRLVNDNDVHEFGQDFDEAIILLSVAKLKGESEIDKGAKNFFAMYKDEINNVKRTNTDKIDWFPSLKRPRGSSLSTNSVHPHLSYMQVGSQYGRRL